ncbi:Hypothetical predicted protein [Mytilus galloprovincialis]|uniref:Uncharacterized protein n=1 Tax=Mytilus galloprovincialis TaxID=29158 RepID=A0A8B6HI48_MYTGA|nr:Hypothetical predicted protein [Mytilus galloprovincialis]
MSSKSSGQKQRVVDSDQVQVTVMERSASKIFTSYKASFFRQIPSTVAGDKHVTGIRGMVIFEDGRLIVIDSKNRCLKIFSPPWFDFVLRHSFSDEPRGVTISGKDEVAITFPDKREVRRFSINTENKVSTQKTFEVREKPFSISHSKETFAIEMGEGKDGCIIITDMDGNLKNLISGIRRNFGQFTGNTIRLAHDHKTSTVFIVDLVNECVNSVNYEGNIKWTIKVNSPRDLDLHEDVLFVASKSDNSVVQMRADDGHITQLLTTKDDINQPRFIWHQPQAKKLAVEVGGNVVNMYQCSKK